MTLWRVRATVDDRPGFLAVLTASLALRSVNILSVQVHGTEAGAVDDFLVDAPGDLSEAELLAAVVRGRGRHPWVRRSEAHHLVDPPTEMLGAAARIVRDPEALAEALGSVLLSTVTRATAPDGGYRSGFTGSRMQIPEPVGGMLLIERDAPPYTPAEYARARALVDLAAEVHRTSGVRWVVALAGGDEIEIRPGTESDAPAVAAMFDRCSTGSLRSRFLVGRPGGRLGGPPHGRPDGRRMVRMANEYPAATLVAISGTGLVVGIGTLGFDGPDAELALLVEDAAQRRGIGTALARRLVGLAASTGAVVLHAHAYRDNAAMIRTFDRLDLDVFRAVDGPVMTLSGDLRVAGGADNAVDATIAQ